MRTAARLAPAPARPRVTGVLLVAIGGLLISGCGGAGGASPSTTSTAPSVASLYHASGSFTPARPAPPLVLKDYQGRPFDLAQARGKAVLVTFLYTHCPDVCPRIASSLRAAQIQLGAEAQKVVIVAVSTDPAGDTPAAVAAFLAARELADGRMRYLIGTAEQLKVVDAQWMVASAPDTSTPGVVNHTAIVYGINASGMLTTVYASNFKPADLAHDVPLLAAS